MTVVYPMEFDTDDLALVVERIRRNYSAHEVHPLDTETMHFGYWDQELGVLPVFLAHIQAAGCQVVQAVFVLLPRAGGGVDESKFANGLRRRQRYR